MSLYAKILLSNISINILFYFFVRLSSKLAIDSGNKKDSDTGRYIMTFVNNPVYTVGFILIGFPHFVLIQLVRKLYRKKGS